MIQAIYDGGEENAIWKGSTHKIKCRTIMIVYTDCLRKDINYVPTKTEKLQKYTSFPTEQRIFPFRIK